MGPAERGARRVFEGSLTMWPWTASTQGELYLFHFHTPLGNLQNARAQASHYVGFSDDLEARIAVQVAGAGAKIVAAAMARGIPYDLYHWPACLAQEKLVKKTHKTALYCPTCCAAAARRVKPLPVPCQQLVLPIDFQEDEIPEVQPLPMDWIEIKTLQGWRHRTVGTLATLDTWDDGLL